MKRPKRAHSCLTLALLFVWQLLAGLAPAQDGFRPIDPIDPPIISPCPTLNARDISEKADFHDVYLVFPIWLNPDPTTFSDGDLTLFGADGYREDGTYIDHRETPLPLPLPGSLPSPNEAEFLLPPAPVIIATFRFKGPGNGWDAQDNGVYRVRLNPESIANRDGRFFPAKFLGGFRCAIIDAEPEPIQPVATGIDFRRQLGADGVTVQYLADVTLTFNSRHVRIDWGELNDPVENVFSTDIKAVRLPLIEPFPVPILEADEVDRLNRGEDLPIGGLRPIDLRQFKHTYRLGSLDPGLWTLDVIVNEQKEGSNSFTVRPGPIDLEAPEASLLARNITVENSRPAVLIVTYTDPSGIDIETLGNSDLLVYSPCVDHPILPNDLCASDWKAQRPRLINVRPFDRELRRVEATYHLSAPGGTWTSENNGFYSVVWQRGEVCDQLGNCNALERLGGFEVAIDDDPAIEAEAEIKVDASNPRAVKAKVHVDFKEAHILTSQSVRRVGNLIYLIAEVEPDPVTLVTDTEEPIPGQLDIDYEIGPLAPGEYVAAFLMNGVGYDREAFQVERIPPIPARVDLTVDTDGADGPTATVTIQFRTPHFVEQGEVQQDGNRLLLPAKARPLPIPLDSTINPPVPEPVVLTYALGDLPVGRYLAVFEMNDFRYAAESFHIDEPGEPIPADVNITIEQRDTGRTNAIVSIAFETPHVIVGRDLHRNGNRFIFEAKARPISEIEDEGIVIRPPRIITLTYPLGILPAGDYQGQFVMNGHPYASTEWTETDGVFDADVDAQVVQTDAGNWEATVRISFSNNLVRMDGPGELTSNDPIFMVNAEAYITDADDLPPEFYEFKYDLGSLDRGLKWFKFFINGVQEARVDFFVQDIPARAEIEFDLEANPDLANVTLQLRDQYLITSQDVRIVGNFIVLSAEGELVPNLPPGLPDPIELTYELGELEPGTYFAAFRFNGQTYATESFVKEGTGTEADVDLSVDQGDTVTLTAKVDFKDPFVVITEPGEPQIEGNRISIRATAARVDFVTEPSGDPQLVEYDLGELAPGPYFVTYFINDRREARLFFIVREDCRPIPHLASIRIGEDEMEWFSKVTLALFRGQQVTEWGTVRQDGNTFHVNVTVECVDHDSPVGDDPIEPGDIPEGIEPDEVGNLRLAEIPVELVSNRYRLGELASGRYRFCVHSRGRLLGCQPFSVRGTPPEVDLTAENITEAADEHRFSISFSDSTGINLESIQNATVWIQGRDNFREEARIIEIISTDDVPTSTAQITYAVNGPGGSWDREDNGAYRVFIEADQVCDIQGNCIQRSALGFFRVRILPEPAEDVQIDITTDEDGNWFANVVIQSQPNWQVVVDNWEPLVMNGHSFVALPTVHLEQIRGPVQPVSHTYNLGQLQPGYYVFALKSNLAHCGTQDFTVAGFEGPSILRWLATRGETTTLADPDNLRAYFFALHPNGRTNPVLNAEIVTDIDGREHLGLRFRRLTSAEGVRDRIQASRDLGKWDNVSDAVDVVERTLDIDGTEVVLICLRQTLAESPYRYLRVHLAEDDPDSE